MKLCDECGLLPATINLTQIVDNESRSFNLCEVCAKKRGIHIAIEESVFDADETVTSVQRIAGDRECPSCRMKLSDFRSKGWLGCPACYKTFETEIDELFLQIHGSSEHKGKKYPGEQNRGGLSRLRQDLDTAIKNEEFERAALLRDAIDELKDAPGLKGAEGK